VEQQPYELTETGWGEFDIGVVVSSMLAAAAAAAALTTVAAVGAALTAAGRTGIQLQHQQQECWEHR
jgi:hypothetical protein